jgi:hypothetical protein
MDAGTTINAGSGQIVIRRPNNITLTGLSQPHNSLPTVAVTVTSASGAIVDAASTATDITANNAALSAATGIGASGTLETAVSRIAGAEHDQRRGRPIQQCRWLADHRHGWQRRRHQQQRFECHRGELEPAHRCGRRDCYGRQHHSDGDRFEQRWRRPGHQLHGVGGCGVTAVDIAAGGTVTLNAGDNFTMPSSATIAAVEARRYRR